MNTASTLHNRRGRIESSDAIIDYINQKLIMTINNIIMGWPVMVREWKREMKREISSLWHMLNGVAYEFTRKINVIPKNRWNNSWIWNETKLEISVDKHCMSNAMRMQSYRSCVVSAKYTSVFWIRDRCCFSPFTWWLFGRRPMRNELSPPMYGQMINWTFRMHCCGARC